MVHEPPPHGPRPPRRRLWVVAGLSLGAVVAAVWLAVPRRFAVEGVSMGPGLLPGDIVRTGVFPACDRLRPPRRFDRWVLAAGDGLALKRLVGLPREEIALVDGDLSVDGRIILAGPSRLAELGSRVPDASTDDLAPADSAWDWSQPAGEVLDDAIFDGESTRVLAPVRDVGLVAEVDVREASAADPAFIRVRVGDTVVHRPLAAPGRHAVAAGRLDGHLVVATWRVPTTVLVDAPRLCLPGGAPQAWDAADPWPTSAVGDEAPALAIDCGDRASLSSACRWRDVAWRPGADGRTHWRLGADEVFLLGDHPAASTDSRRWGPVAAARLRHRIVACAAP